MPKIKAKPDLLNAAQAAELVGVTAGTLARWVRYNKLAVVKVGRWNRYTPKAVTGLILELHPTVEAKQRIAKLKQMLADADKDKIVARTKA